jgi:hypothetical protein
MILTGMLELRVLIMTRPFIVYVYDYSGIFPALSIQKRHLSSSCVILALANPALSMTNSLPVLSSGTPGSADAVNLSALGSPVAKKDEKAP